MKPNIWRFPRCIHRGLIEALKRCSAIAGSASFPRCIHRGLIEAWQDSQELYISAHPFPRCIHRGLIEAVPSRRYHHQRNQVSAVYSPRPH